MIALIIQVFNFAKFLWKRDKKTMYVLYKTTFVLFGSESIFLFSCFPDEFLMLGDSPPDEKCGILDCSPGEKCCFLLVFWLLDGHPVFALFIGLGNYL